MKDLLDQLMFELDMLMPASLEAFERHNSTALRLAMRDRIAIAMAAALDQAATAAQVKIGRAWLDGIESEREACALVCDDISIDRWRRFKGRGEHAPNNPGRADPFIEGQSHGADACADAIRARSTTTPPTPDTRA